VGLQESASKPIGGVPDSLANVDTLSMAKIKRRTKNIAKRRTLGKTGRLMKSKGTSEEKSKRLYLYICGEAEEKKVRPARGGHPSATSQ